VDSRSPRWVALWEALQSVRGPDGGIDLVALQRAQDALLDVASARVRADALGWELDMRTHVNRRGDTVLDGEGRCRLCRADPREDTGHAAGCRWWSAP